MYNHDSGVLSVHAHAQAPLPLFTAHLARKAAQRRRLLSQDGDLAVGAARSGRRRHAQPDEDGMETDDEDAAPKARRKKKSKRLQASATGIHDAEEHRGSMEVRAEANTLF